VQVEVRACSNVFLIAGTSTLLALRVRHGTKKTVSGEQADTEPVEL
jgi:hypothetical protein